MLSTSSSFLKRIFALRGFRFPFLNGEWKSAIVGKARRVGNELAWCLSHVLGGISQQWVGMGREGQNTKAECLYFAWNETFGLNSFACMALPPKEERPRFCCFLLFSVVIRWQSSLKVKPSLPSDMLKLPFLCRPQHHRLFGQQRWRPVAHNASAAFHSCSYRKYTSKARRETNEHNQSSMRPCSPWACLEQSSHEMISVWEMWKTCNWLWTKLTKPPKAFMFCYSAQYGDIKGKNRVSTVFFLPIYSGPFFLSRESLWSRGTCLLHPRKEDTPRKHN